jgi:hypothetical protein
MSFNRAQRPNFASNAMAVNTVSQRTNLAVRQLDGAQHFQQSRPMPIPSRQPIPVVPEEEEEEEDEWTLSRIMYEKPSKKIVRQYFKDKVEQLQEDNEGF